MRDKRKKYIVRWLGYPATFKTWSDVEKYTKPLFRKRYLEKYASMINDGRVNIKYPSTIEVLARLSLT